MKNEKNVQLKVVTNNQYFNQKSRNPNFCHFTIESGSTL